MDLIQGPSHDRSQTIVDFLRFSCDELGLEQLPRINMTSTPLSNRISNSFAAYDPGNRSVTVCVKSRHIMDVLRSLAHELVHYRQDLNDELTPDSGQTGSPQEDEANAVAGRLMRKFGKIHPELFNIRT